MLFVIMVFAIIRPTCSRSSQFEQIESKLFFNWFYQILIRMKIKFPWNKIFVSEHFVRIVY
jgi:hypothetical protein